MTLYMFFIRNVTYVNIFLEMFRTPRDDISRVEMFRAPYLAVQNVSYPGNKSPGRVCRVKNEPPLNSFDCLHFDS